MEDTSTTEQSDFIYVIEPVMQENGVEISPCSSSFMNVSSEESKLFFVDSQPPQYRSEEHLSRHKLDVNPPNADYVDQFQHAQGLEISNSSKCFEHEQTEVTQLLQVKNEENATDIQSMRTLEEKEGLFSRAIDENKFKLTSVIEISPLANDSKDSSNIGIPNSPNSPEYVHVYVVDLNKNYSDTDSVDYTEDDVNRKAFLVTPSKSKDLIKSENGVEYDKHELEKEISRPIKWKVVNPQKAKIHRPGESHEQQHKRKTLSVFGQREWPKDIFLKQCVICQSTFKEINNFIEHYLPNFEDDRPYFHCCICMDGTSHNLEQYESHLWESHAIRLPPAVKSIKWEIESYQEINERCFLCSKCDFISPKEMKEHLNGLFKNICCICSTSFPHEDGYFIHLSDKHCLSRTDSFVLKLVSLESMAALNTIIQSHPNLDTICEQCDLCKRPFGSWKSCLLHYCHGNGNKYYYCCKCNAWFDKQDVILYISHFNKRHKCVPKFLELMIPFVICQLYNCDICKSIFHCHSKLVDHVCISKSKIDVKVDACTVNSFFCIVCKKVCHEGTARHYASLWKGAFKCCVCHLIYSSFDKLRFHCKTDHNSVPVHDNSLAVELLPPQINVHQNKCSLYVCELCKIGYPSMTLNLRHFSSPLSKGYFQCCKCKLNCASLEKFKHHCVLHHGVYPSVFSILEMKLTKVNKQETGKSEHKTLFPK